MLKRRFLKAVRYFEALGMIETEDKAATLTLFTDALLRTARRNADRQKSYYSEMSSRGKR